MDSYEWGKGGSRGRVRLFPPLAVLALSGILMILPRPAQEGISRAIRGSVLAPFLGIQESLQRFRVQASEAGELQVKLDAAEALIHSQSALAEENRRLRELLVLRDRSTATYVPASLLRAGTLGSESMFLLDAGRRDGVTVNAPVTTAAGLVGVTREVGPRRALAMDWTHPDFRASAMTEDGSVFGIVESRGGGIPDAARLMLNGVPFRTEVADGTPVVTSGRGAIYPRGIPIGHVVGLAEIEAGWRRSYWIEPVAHPGSAMHVLVLTGEDTEEEESTGPGDATALSGAESTGTADPAGPPAPSAAEMTAPAPAPSLPGEAAPSPAEVP